MKEKNILKKKEFHFLKLVLRQRKIFLKYLILVLLNYKLLKEFDKEILIKELEMENEGENNNVEGNTPGILENTKEIKVNGKRQSVINYKKKNCKC